MKLHILGIAGTFMGGVAALAREMGHEVEGSDQNIYPPMSTQLEQLGIARTWRALEHAHAALILVDAAHGVGAPEQAILARLAPALPKIWVHNKIDLTGEAPQSRQVDGERHVYLSARSGLGVELLTEELLRIAGWQSASEGVFMARNRHLQAMRAVEAGLVRAAGLLGQAELFAEELRQAQEALNSITGEFTSDDLLGEIFSRFCIGK